MNHVEEFAATFRRGGEALAEFIPQARQLATVEGAIEITEIVERRMAAGEVMHYRMAEGRPEDRRPMFGNVNLRNHSLEEASAMLGAWMLPEYQGQGLVRPASETIMDYAARDDVWGLRIVYAMTAVHNEHGRRALKHLGFRQLGAEPFLDQEGFAATGVRQMVHMWRKDI